MHVCRLRRFGDAAAKTDGKIMKTKTRRNSCFLVITAFIWGVAFVAQSAGGNAVGPYSFNFTRNIIGCLVLLPVIALLEKLGFASRKSSTKAERKQLILGGICCGCALFAASTLQQVGINSGVSAGKAGFFTACYIILVPIFGIFLKRKCGWNVWLGVLLTVGGLYLLSMSGNEGIQTADLLVMLCAVCFAVHILVIDHFTSLVDGVRMASIQFLTCGLLSAIPMILCEIGFAPGGLSAWAGGFCSQTAWIAILYAGIGSSGIAYTLQIVGQEDVNPTIASLIMSLESVFSAFAGWLILHETMSAKELLGCGLVFAAVVLAQIPVGRGAGGRMES